MKIRDIKTIEERRKFIEKKVKRSLSAIKVYPQGLEAAQFKNCENMIGAVQLPLGIAGPLMVKGQLVKGEYYIPLATTEGALVASVSRGCKAASLSGGVKVITRNIGMTRSPVFKTSGIEKSIVLESWLKNNFSRLQKIAQNTSAHLQLLKIDASIAGRNIYVRFYFDTEDAMGMNMATIATQEVSQFIEKETGAECISIASNFDVDKKPASLNFILGRGRKVWAEALIERKIVAEVLKTTPEKIHEVAINKCLIGSAMSGSLGFNAHFANIISAIFIACGQDAAHVVEGSLGITTTDIVDSNLYISIYLPDLAVGTVGGGTNLPSQKEALSILGISGGDGGENARRFAEIVGASVLAGELSLLAALAEGSLASAHQKLARNK
ncbi:hydroxymethylglutaryl-CoA reductase (NADPH) [Candidatus Gottesmanbacteria bacterium]|nr:hydroxymethylglutaryl-CoA reductase (NADPH) [Candidatus Gottesmanbacteria bacterium]